MVHMSPIRRLERDARRVTEIGGVLVKYGLADWLQRIPGSRSRGWWRDADGQAIPGTSTAHRLRLALSELGTTFVKLGQMLSTRPDVVGRELAAELSHLQTGTPPDPPGAAQTIVEEELGRPVEALFARFDPAPMASASIAQVHAARLHTGEEVVVKVQKRGIVARIEADLGILAELAELAEKHVAELKPYRPVALVRLFTKMLRSELDFARERQNLEEFRLNFAEDAGVHFPQPVPELSSRRVLTMERLQGVLVADVQRIRGLGLDLDGFARRGARMYLDMVFRDSFYHADPHPGNLMALPGGVVGVIDCGMVQRLESGLREEIEMLMLGVVRGDAESLTDVVWNLGLRPPTGTREQLRAELAEFVAEYTRRSLNELDLGGALTSMTEIIQRNHVFLPPPVSLLIRTLVELEGTAQLLDPDFNLAEVIHPYYRKTVARRFSPMRLIRRLQRGSRDWDRLMTALPRDLNEVMHGIRAGTLSLHLDHRHLDPVVNRLVLGLLTSSLFVGSSLLWSMKAPPLIRGVSLFGAVGYGLALVLGFRLFRLIHGSEVEGRDQD
jgi:ubiquinone biosynthesis protein